MKDRCSRCSNARCIAGLVACILLLFCSSVRLLAIAGLEGTFEFGLDAPWRIEPNVKPDGTIEHGAIPIQITIHGAMDTVLDNVLYAKGESVQLHEFLVSLGRFYSVRVKELAPVEQPAVEFPLASLFEIEATTGAWPWPTGSRNPPVHRICRVWAGDNPEPFRDISSTSEWHAALWYVPHSKEPGTWVSLQIDVILERYQWPLIKTPKGEDVPINVSRFITLRNYVRVYLAREPLPRFDNRWLYGDFHYHSQGTDNEGEAGYNYRGVIRAMGAMGLDFLFATEHASNSEQIIDADLPRVDRIAGIAHSQGNKLTEENVRATGGVLRDMDANRYAFCHDIIYSKTGANNEASYRASSSRFPQNFKSYGVVPQLFLGGEIDAVGEVNVATVAANTVIPSVGPVAVTLPYGNGLRFDLGHLCSPAGCDDPRSSILKLLGDSESYLAFDFQSLESWDHFGRQHLVYFPNSSDLKVGDETTFIPSYTSRFGGATRRLDRFFAGENFSAQPPLLPEVERKGVVFIAHHLNAGGGRGPDGVPWTTDHMLLRAFRSPAVLGLEFWNEDTRYRTPVCSHLYCRDPISYGMSLSGRETGYERNETLELHFEDPLHEALNVIALKPLLELFDYNPIPKEFHKIALPLEEVRHGFVRGGNAGSLFELLPFEIRTGLWQFETKETERTLHHGAFDWDMINLRGLNFEANRDLDWLAPGEPRRMFMGGGSDAHGDFNYRRAGYFLGTDDANDTAIGKPRNLVFVGPPEGLVVYREEPTRAPEGASAPAPDDDASSPAASRRQIQSRPILSPQIFRPPGIDPVPPILEPVPPPPRNPIPPPVIRPPQEPPVTDPTPPPPPPAEPIDPVGPPPADPPVVSPDPPPVAPTPTEPPPTEPPPSQPPPRPRPGIGDIGVDFGPEIRAHSQEQIIRALRAGRFCVTDGPALRIAIDSNGNQQIDDADTQMGGVHRIDTTPLANRSTVVLLTEVISTAEFGPIMDIDVYVGAHPDAPAGGAAAPVEPRMYAPLIHGPGGFDDAAQPSPQRSYVSGGRTYVRLKDNYWNGEFFNPSLTWKHTSGTPLRYTHTHATTIHLNEYEVGEGIAANRFFVRAFARTSGNVLAHIPDRYAYSNPIWILRGNSTRPGDIQPPDVGLPDGINRPAPPPTISAGWNEKGEMVITFTGTLQFATTLTGEFQDLTEAVSPYTVPLSASTGFFRSRK